MKNQLPYFWFHPDAYKNAFIFFLIMTLITMVGMQITNEAMVTEKSPLGVLDFELAGDMKTAKTMINSWVKKDPEYGLIKANFNMGLDYLFLFVYSQTIGLACLIISRKKNRFIKTTKILAALLLVAALLDAVENYGLIQMIQGANDEFYPKLALYCATPKFIIILAGLLFSLFGLFIKKKP